MAPTVKNAKRVPVAVPGEGMAEFVRRSSQMIKSDSMVYDDTSPANLIELPGNVLVKGGFVHVTTAFDASGSAAAATLTLTVPNDTGTETIFDASTNFLQTTGFHPVTGYALTPSSGGYVIATYTAGSTTQGALEVYLDYVDLANRL